MEPKGSYCDLFEGPQQYSGCRVSFLGVKQPGRLLTTHPINAEIKEGVELYPCAMACSKVNLLLRSPF